MKIFIDTAPLIYLIEGKESFAAAVEKQMNQCITAEENLTTSTLTLLELLVVPKRQEKKQLATQRKGPASQNTVLALAGCICTIITMKIIS